jgi:fused-like protein
MRCLSLFLIPNTVGNAAFHSGELYPQLEASIAPLCVALQDPDEKTRANAAGAIGNLIRNGATLSQAMADQRVVEMLMYILMNDSDLTPKVSSMLSGILFVNGLTNILGSFFTNLLFYF